MHRRLWLGLVVAVLGGCGGADQSPLAGDDAAVGADSGNGDVTIQPAEGGTIDSGTPDVITTIDTGTPDTFVGPADSKILCGPTITCSAQTQVCCHHMNAITAWECVADVSACQGNLDVPLSCSSAENCTSQGNSGFVCCGDTQQIGNCSVASNVACAAACDPSQVQVGCSVQNQDCADQTQTCSISKCTLPGYAICL